NPHKRLVGRHRRWRLGLVVGGRVAVGRLPGGRRVPWRRPRCPARAGRLSLVRIIFRRSATACSRRSHARLMNLSSVRVSLKDAADVVQETEFPMVRIDDVAAGRPWRVFRSHHGQAHYSGWYWSATMGRHVVYESRLELARLLLADFDPTVIAIA